MRKSFFSATLTALALSTVGVAAADPVYCSEVSTDKNYMSIDESEVSACLLSGYGKGSAGNLSGNPKNDPFLLDPIGADYSLAGKSDDEDNFFNILFSQDGSWSFDESFWDSNSEGAIGFKFGTGNKPDEWFVFSLISGVSSGSWDFFSQFDQRGGLSHVNLYGNSVSVPEPGTLVLLGAGLLLVGLRRPRKKAHLPKIISGV